MSPSSIERSENPAPSGPLGRLRRLLANLKPPRKLKLTREGKYYLLITLGVGFAAVNTGNNLLYLLLGMFLSLIVVSSVMSEISLRHLSVVRRLPPRRLSPSRRPRPAHPRRPRRRPPPTTPTRSAA